MQWIETKVSFDGGDEALIVDLIADVFYGLNAKGVVVDDPHLEPLESWAPDAIALPERPAVTGYLPADNRLENHRQHLEQRVAGLAARFGFKYAVQYKAIDEQDWSESWKAFFWPQQISPRIVVKPSWRDYQAESGQVIIELDPGMAFGTGTHASTALCIRLLEKHLQTGWSVLDVGTGSGILMVAAAKLGAPALTGIDLDPMAVAVARENLIRNGIDPHRFELACGHLVDKIVGAFDLVVANILADVIIDLLEDISRVLKSGGIFICSGIIEAFESDVAQKMTARGLELVDMQKDGEWVALVGRAR